MCVQLRCMKESVWWGRAFCFTLLAIQICITQQMACYVIYNVVMCQSSKPHVFRSCGEKKKCRELKSRQCISNQKDTLPSSGLQIPGKAGKDWDPEVLTKIPHPAKKGPEEVGMVGVRLGETKPARLCFPEEIFLMSWREQRENVAVTEMLQKKSHKRKAALEPAPTCHYRLRGSQGPGSDP